MKTLYSEKFLLLAIGLVLLIFSNGKWIVPVATWISFIFLLRFFRYQKDVWQFFIGIIAYVGVFCIAWQGLIKFPGMMYYAVAGGIGLIFFLPFVIDKFIYQKISGFIATLIFPLAWTTTEFIGFTFSPFGTWGSLAYTQYGNLPFMQIASITGIYGLTFLITWFASALNWVWEKKFEWSKIRKGVGIYVGIIVAVLLYGGTYLMFLSPKSNEVKVAGVQSDIAEEILKPVVDKINTGDLSREIWDTYFSKTNIIVDDLFAKSEIAAKSGARMIAWSENPVMIRQKEESRLIKKGQKFARQSQAYLVMNYSINLSDDPRKAPAEKFWSDRTVIISSSGDVLSTYRKTILVPGMEATLAVSGNDQARVVDTPYGRITSLICFDNDFPSFVRRQVGGKGVDILFDPSGDWKGLEPFHTNMMAYRAIENGFSVVRVTSSGLSAVYDYQGRTLATMDYFKTNDKVFIAHVPQKGIKTIYSQIGDVFAWLAIVGLVILIGFSLNESQIPFSFRNKSKIRNI